MAVLLVAGTGRAQEAESADAAPDYIREGAYLGARAMIGIPFYEEEFSDELNMEVHSDYVAGFDLLLGYRVHANAALEIDVEYAREQDSFDLDIVSVTYNVRAYPITGWLQPYVLAGIGVIDTNEDKTDFTARFGLGVDYYLTGNIVLNANWSYLLPSSAPKPDYISFTGGILYRF